MAGKPVPPAKPLAAILEEITYRPDALEVMFVKERRVACDGPGRGLGHPRVFYTIGDPGYAECGYCDRIFVHDVERAGEIFTGDDPKGLENDPQPSLKHDGVTESAVPPPGESLESGGDNDASEQNR
jgi:uncharacterized Zn-finger protein